ncbi:ABC transporter ATP-binding protein [Streptococcus merionis]|uniref:ABC-type quaternary amine transporter n=1 Tax=Streptococcus merionis TaxID=400065 RepID=A0A239SMM9_9STRE|nr:ABC transporter ATP-binding protein [Streptococcus merionis]SNU86646.1 spermidine/putrescine import ATP-binding protein PotA [Streptococcus merionis]
MAFIDVRELTKSYGNHTVIENISISMEEGSLTTLLGASGSGKSTLLRCIAGLESIDCGKILIQGKDVTQLEPRERNVGMVFQHYALFPNMTVLENVMFGLRMKGISDMAKAKEMLKIVGLETKETAYPKNLSGGQQQRVALARSLVVEPKVLFLDEPLSALDSKIRVELRNLIKDIQHRLGITMVLVTHDQEEAMTMSDKIYILADGLVEQEGTPSEIYRHPKTPYVAKFIGNHNLFTMERFQKLVDGPAVAARLIALRPETLTVIKPVVDHYCLTGIVKRTSMLGSVLRFWLDVNHEEVIMDQLNRSAFFKNPGDSITVYLIKDDIIVID